MLSVLLYTGEGADPEAREDLKSLLTSYLTQRCCARGNFCITETSDGAEFRDPARLLPHRLVAFPGGFDLGFVRCLGEAGMENLRRHVRTGGAGYLGMCAGAYFACRRIEFAKGDPQLQVTGSRLGLYRGSGIGPAFPGFDYRSLAGARAAEVAPTDSQSEVHAVYFNGGPKFIEDSTAEAADADAASAKRLAVYTEAGAAGEAAVVLSRCGYGAALLFGTHPEMSKRQLEHSDEARLRQIFARLRDGAAERLRATYRMLDMLMNIVEAGT